MPVPEPVNWMPAIAPEAPVAVEPPTLLAA